MAGQTTQQVILPNEYQQQVGQSQQRQQLVQALAGQLMKQPTGQVVGGVYTGGANAGTALSQILATLAMGKSLDKQQQFERDALTQYRTGERQAISDYVKAGSGNRDAIIGAMTSPYTSLQGLGTKDYEQMNKENTPFTRLIQQATGLGGAGPDQAAAQQLQSIFPNLTMQEIVTGIAADPSGKTLYNASIERGKNVAVPDGATLMRPTAVGQAVPVGGVQQAQVSNAGAITEAKERAKAQWDLAPPIETPEGTSFPTRAQVVGASGGMSGAPVNLGPAQGMPQQGNRASWQVPPAAQAGRDQERLAILREEYANARTPQDRAALEREMARIPGGSSPMASGAPGLQVPYNTASKAADKATRESDVKTYEEARTKAQSAGQALNQIAQMRQSIKSGTFAGGYANLAERVAAFAGPLGIPIDQSKLSDTQYVKSTLQNLIVPQVKKLGVNPTDADAKRIEAMVGSITTDPGAFDKIMSLLEKSAKKDMDTFRRMDGHLRKNNSLAGFDYQLEQQEPAGSSQANPMSLDDYLKSRSK